MLRILLISVGWCISLPLVGMHAFAQGATGTASAGSCARVLEPTLVERFEATHKARTVEARPIYGCDDRRNLYDPALSQPQKQAAQATAILVKSNQLKASGTTFELPGKGAGLCSPEQVAEAKHDVPERFWDEPAPGFCSEFKIGPRLIATAGHCINDNRQCRGDGSKDAPERASCSVSP